MASSLTIENVHAAYGAVRVIHDVSMAVNAGETVALLGTNGNGKSTLMKCIMGIVRPAEGRIVAEIDGEKQCRLCRHRAGQFELAHLDLGQVARPAARLIGEIDVAQQRLATLGDRRVGQMMAVPGVDRVEQRDAQVVGDGHARERPRQLEAAREPEARALVGGEAPEVAAVAAPCRRG